MATIKDVAKKARVSISTVSHVVNHTKNVSPDTALRVEQAIKELNYKTNIFAKNLKSQKTKQIGVVVLDMCGMFFPYVIKEICRIANKSGYAVTLMDSGGSIKLERQAISALLESCVDGIILSSVIQEAQKEAYAAELLELLSMGPKRIPLVTMERDFSSYGIDSICTDTYAGGISAVEHLIALGCQYIAHIAAPQFEVGRCEAYRDTLKKHHLPYHPAYVEEGDFSHESGYACMKRLLEKQILIDSVFVANDQMAVGVLQALHEAGVRIPEDMKVIGFDNIFICDTIEPALSSINMDKSLLGQKSISLLLDRIQHGAAPVPHKEVLENTLVVRRSTDKNVAPRIGW
ncbi:LacI family transcriptional regulator [bacterium 1XD21-13]|nr:LacI family transcriptional regulator [bacterium 1XD21-13]